MLKFPMNIWSDHIVFYEPVWWMTTHRLNWTGRCFLTTMLPVLDGELVILCAVKLISVSCALLQEKWYTCVWSTHMHKVNCLIEWLWVLKYLWNIWCQIKWHWLYFYSVETATALSINSLSALKTRCWSFECWFICVCGYLDGKQLYFVSAAHKMAVL